MRVDNEIGVKLIEELFSGDLNGMVIEKTLQMSYSDTYHHYRGNYGFKLSKGFSVSENFTKLVTNLPNYSEDNILLVKIDNSEGFNIYFFSKEKGDYIGSTVNIKPAHNTSH